MHWFWRALVAVLVGSSLSAALVLLLASPTPMRVNAAILRLFLFLVLPSLIALLAYEGLTRRYAPPIWDGMSHCRRCGYDLTGNVSGYCPECGETIACAGS